MVVVILKVLAIVQGEWGERIVKHIREKAPESWFVNSIKISTSLPLIIEEPFEFIPAKIPCADLLVSLGESPQAAQLIAAIAKSSGAKAVIIPIDNSRWLPQGLKSQVGRSLDAMGVATVFPKPFCSLSETGNHLIDGFAKYFGKPKLKITCGNSLEEITVIRGAPCGSTHSMAERCRGVSVLEAREKCALAAHHHPCLASMEIDPELDDTIMHKSGFFVMEEVERAITECLGRKPWVSEYIDPQ